MREADFYYEHTGDFYVYDRQSQLTSVMLWSRPWKPQRDFVVWLNNSSLLTNAGENILYLNMANRTRHELLRDEIAALPGDIAFMAPSLSTDGAWLLVATDDGSLHLRNIFAALAEFAFPEIAGSAT